MRIVIGVILSILCNCVGFVPEYTWALIVFVLAHIGVNLMQKLKKLVRYEITLFIHTFHIFYLLVDTPF